MSENSKILKSSPIFSLTLGAKELCHSNFWAWMIEINENGKHPFIEIFIPGFCKSGYRFIKVEREKAHRDLTIYFEDEVGDKKALIIENKLKSIPTEEQLRRYEENFKEKEYSYYGGVITGINQILGDNGWSFISYKDISERIENIICKFNLNEIEHIDIIRLYSRDIKLIHELIEEDIANNHNVYQSIAPNQLESIRLGDVYLKYRANELKSYINSRLTDLHKSKWGLPFVAADFNNKKPTISILYRQFDSDTEIGILGVQIEGNQFRLHCGYNSDKYKFKNKEQLLHKLKNLKYLEKYNKEEKLIRNKKSSMKKEFCKYTNDDKGSVHIYQYWNLNDKISFEELFLLIEKEIKMAKKLIDEGFSYC